MEIIDSIKLIRCGNQVILLQLSPCQQKDIAAPEVTCLTLTFLWPYRSQDFCNNIRELKPLRDLFFDVFYEQRKERKSCWSKNWQPDLLRALSNQLKERETSKKHHAHEYCWKEDWFSHREKPLVGWQSSTNHNKCIVTITICLLFLSF